MLLPLMRLRKDTKPWRPNLHLTQLEEEKKTTKNFRDHSSFVSFANVGRRGALFLMNQGQTHILKIISATFTQAVLGDWFSGRYYRLVASYFRLLSLLDHFSSQNLPLLLLLAQPPNTDQALYHFLIPKVAVVFELWLLSICHPGSIN